MSARQSSGSPAASPDSLAEAIRSTVDAARAEALETLRARLRAALVEAWWPEVRRMAGLDASESPAPGRADEVVYVYGFTKTTADALAGLSAVEPGRSVERVVLDDVCALVTRVPVELYSEAGLRSAMTDTEWLATRVRNHDAVLRRAAELAPVLPLRLCAVYRDETRVRAILSENRETIAGELRRLEGHREWGVKLHAEPDFLQPVGETADRLKALRAEVEEATPGHARFARQRLEQIEDEARCAVADEIAAASHAALASASADSVRLEVQPANVSGRPEPQILHGAYLVADKGRPSFEAVLESLEERTGLAVKLTGPWPPFHFSKLELRMPPPIESHG